MAALSFVIDSLFNLSDRNVLVAMLAHQSATVAHTWLNMGRANVASVGLLLVVAIVLRSAESRQARALAVGQGRGSQIEAS